jgi:predicted dehydrogenase
MIAQRGDLGEIYHAKAYWYRRTGSPKMGTWFVNKKLAGGGCMLDIGVHFLDLALYITDNWKPTCVSGQVYTKFGNRDEGLATSLADSGAPLGVLTPRPYSHRDFNVERRLADLRYENWLRTLHAAGKVYGLTWEGGLAGFIAHEGGKLVLHALGGGHRGRGIARHLWSAVCADLVRNGASELSSSISIANTAALNLYASLGFRFRNPVDIYHRVIR